MIEYIIKLNLTREYCIKSRNGTDNSFTNCRQINEIEKLIVDGVRKITNEKIYTLRMIIILTALGKDLVC